MNASIDPNLMAVAQGAAGSVPVLIAGLSPIGPGTAYADELCGAMSGAPLFKGLERSEMDALAALMEVYDAPEGLTLIHEGEVSDHMIVLISGQVDVLRRNRANTPSRIAVADPGNTLGEMSLFDGEPRFASCVTLAPTRFALLTQWAMMGFLRANPELGGKVLIKLVHMLSDRLRQTSSRLVSLIEALRSEAAG